MRKGAFCLFWCLSQESYSSQNQKDEIAHGSHNLKRYRGMTTSFHVKTEVLFGEHKPDIIDWYLSTGEYKDKAGGYGTQAIGAFLIKEIRGCYYNVMGLPIHRLIEEIMKLTSKDE